MLHPSSASCGLAECGGNEHVLSIHAFDEAGAFVVTSSHLGDMEVYGSACTEGPHTDIQSPCQEPQGRLKNPSSGLRNHQRPCQEPSSEAVALQTLKNQVQGASAGQGEGVLQQL